MVSSKGQLIPEKLVKIEYLCSKNSVTIPDHFPAKNFIKYQGETEAHSTVGLSWSYYDMNQI